VISLPTGMYVRYGMAYYHKYKDQSSVRELEADKDYACCDLCGKNISCARKVGTGGLAKNIKSKHEGQLKYVPAAYGGTLDINLDSQL
jgi:hypothetical protein